MPILFSSPTTSADSLANTFFPTSEVRAALDISVAKFVQQERFVEQIKKALSMPDSQKLVVAFSDDEKYAIATISPTDARVFEPSSSGLAKELVAFETKSPILSADFIRLGKEQIIRLMVADPSENYRLLIAKLANYIKPQPTGSQGLEQYQAPTVTTFADLLAPRGL